MCHGCIKEKQAYMPFPSDGVIFAPKPFGIVHSDVCGPMKTTSIGKAKYFVTFIDDFSKKIWLYVIRAKSECFDKFKEFKVLVEKQFKLKIKMFR